MSCSRCKLVWLIGLTISATAANEVNNTPFDAITLIAYNTSNGTELKYKHTTSPNIEIVLFEGLYLSSIGACGNDLHRCPNLTVFTRESISLVVLPLGEIFGLVSLDVYTDEEDNHSITFREKHILNITSLDLDCQLTSIFLPKSRSASMLQIIQGICFHRDSTEGGAVDFIRAEVNATHLSQSGLLTYRNDDSCGSESTELSEFVHFYSEPFKTDVFIFIDDGTIRFKKNSGVCSRFDHLRIDGEVERFVGVSSNVQAIYSTQGIYILDISENARFPSFTVAVDGFPLFCSSTIFCSFINRTLSLHYVESRNRTIGNLIPFPYEDVMGGDCLVTREDTWFAVVQLKDDRVVTANLNTSEVHVLGVSLSFPRLFGSFVLLSNETHTFVRNLNDGVGVDTIDKRPSLGYVMFYDTDTETTVSSTEVTSSSGSTDPPEPEANRVNLVAILVPVLFFCCVGSVIGVACCLCEEQDAYPVNAQAEVETNEQQQQQRQPSPPLPLEPRPPSPPPPLLDNNNRNVIPDNNRS